MKKIFFLGLFCFSLHAADDANEQAFKKCYELYSARDLKGALNCFQKFYEARKDQKSQVYGSAFFNIPVLYEALGDKAAALEWYEKILAAPVSDRDTTGDLMEPHANYKHKAAIKIAIMKYRAQEYDAALRYIQKAKIDHPYIGFEGSATGETKELFRIFHFETDVYTDMGDKLGALACGLDIYLNSHYAPGFSEFKTKLKKLIAAEPGDEKTFKAFVEDALEKAVFSKEKGQVKLVFLLKNKTITVTRPENSKRFRADTKRNYTDTAADFKREVKAVLDDI